MDKKEGKEGRRKGGKEERREAKEGRKTEEGKSLILLNTETDFVIFF